MSKNAHKNSTWKNEINFRKCPKSKCQGTLIHCQVRYKPRGPIHNELECSECSLIKKDSKFSNKNKLPRNFVKNAKHTT